MTFDKKAMKEPASYRVVVRTYLVSTQVRRHERNLGNDPRFELVIGSSCVSKISTNFDMVEDSLQVKNKVKAVFVIEYMNQ